MSLKDLEVEELTIVDSLNFHLALYDVADLVTVEECKGASNTITDIYNKYRNVHVVLRKEIDDYPQKYPKFEEVETKVKTYLKSVKQILRDKESQSRKSAYEEDLHNLLVEVDIVKNRVNRHNFSFEGNLLLLKDENVFDKYVTKMEGFTDEFLSLSTRLKCLCPDFDKEFKEEFDTFIFEIEQDIILATRAKRAVLQFKQDCLKREKAATISAETVSKAESLKTEITFRFKSLSSKFDVDLDNLGDSQILELNQNKNLDLEFNSILEKVTELSSLSTVNCANIDKLIKSVTKTRGRLALKKDTFFSKLQKIIVDRDITTEKLKNGSDLLVDFPRFSGYQCEIDFFTFRTKFRRLIEQKHQKKDWVDYLKHNYLCGQALLLVKNEKDYEKIWDRLSESFGNQECYFRISYPRSIKLVVCLPLAMRKNLSPL